ncbi:uncharacterized protein LOC126687133 isoform X2 [Mercurialis annua]|nr:uncharacterized protein LOC126687133 isoform X2 [Mercurialis annua]
MYKQVKCLPVHLRWPHMQADQVHGLGLREIGGGFVKHHRAPSIRSTCYTIAKPLTMVQKMQTIKKLRGHRDAVYCAIFDRSGRYVITGSDDRLVKIWSMETAFCLASCRGHEGDITDLAVTSNNTLVASASNDFSIRVWRLPDGVPISVLRGHTSAVTAIAFSPRPNAAYQLLSSSDDGTCRIWDARYSQCNPQIFVPRPSDGFSGKNNGPSSSNGTQSNQILCCAYNANGTVFVTGSSDTYARVWSASKSGPDDSNQTIHEIEVLSGHQNDVNYVQFSGCAVASRSSFSDILKEENVPKFKNSWFCHDNIVTCSRDGSAIIWVPKSRRSHGKSLRWEKSFHLKVPPPPLPPQPPRGGPRQRILPTPRGVNMIVWSLDNRFVLAAIMDCRICVWNASNSALVHSLTGHTASSYVLDVHPFNPRIAMSAGYDGRTIVWDIWEGIPIHIYEIGFGRLKLVDGKFSPDGLSIVLSDDAGQIHFINTGQADCQKDAKYDQFFLGDYRPLIRDSSGNVLDQETQLPPYRRNIQDLLCDSSMLPYPEPYQTMFQKRRLGELGVDWHPPSMKFAVGLDFSLGFDYQLLPLEDLDRLIEPLPEFIDAIYWEPENEVISDDNDSEYNVTEDCASEGERGSLCYSSASDPDCSMEDIDIERSQQGGFPRSRRRKQKAKLIEFSGRRVRKRNLTERDDSVYGSNGAKKFKSARKVSKRKSSKAISSRPQRVAARNALTMFPKMTETSTDGDDEDNSEEAASSSESGLLDSDIESDMKNMPVEYAKEEKLAVLEVEDIAKPPKLVESQSNSGSKKKLIVKLSFRSKKPVSPKDSVVKIERQGDQEIPSPGPLPESNIDLRYKDPGSSSSDAIDVKPSQNCNRVHITGVTHHEKVEHDIKGSAVDSGSKIRLGEVTNQTFQHSRLEMLPGVQSATFNANSDACMESWIDANGDEDQFQLDQDGAKSEEPVFSGVIQRPLTIASSSSSSLGDLQSKSGASAVTCTRTPDEGAKDLSVSDKCRGFDSLAENEFAGTSNGQGLKENPPRKITKLKIKTSSKLKSLREVNDSTHQDAVGLMSENPSYLPVQKQLLGLWKKDEGSSKLTKGIPHMDGANLEDLDYVLQKNPSDAILRTKSVKLKATTREPHDIRMKEYAGTSKNDDIQPHPEEKILNSRMTERSRSARNMQDDDDPTCPMSRKLTDSVRKLSWLTLSKLEGGYRYIPQLGDEVVYFRQGHQQYIQSATSSQKCVPWSSNKGYVSAVEICSVESLEYDTGPGGDSCCNIRLRFVSPSSGVFGQEFDLTLPELLDFPDFIIEKAWYDATIGRNWMCGDNCQVWWRYDNGEGGRWWECTIISSKAKSEEFPDSPWERYNVKYNNDFSEQHWHCPWELHDPEMPWEHPIIDFEIREKLLSSFEKLELSGSRKKDSYGIRALNENSQKLEFFNRYPVPLCPEIIRSRVENNYYRTVEAVKHDVNVMMNNARSYFARNREVLHKMKKLSDWYCKKLSKILGTEP